MEQKHEKVKGMINLSVIKILKEYKREIEKFLDDAKYRLAQSPPKDKLGIEDITMVIPKVTIGCLPHQNFSLYGAPDIFFQAPYIKVGYEEADIENDEMSISMLIQVCCYPSETYETETALPDNQALTDLTLFLEWLRDKILTKQIAGAPIEGGVKIGTYNSRELTYPYAYGYVSFSVKTIKESIKKFDYR